MWNSYNDELKKRSDEIRWENSQRVYLDYSCDFKAQSLQISVASGPPVKTIELQFLPSFVDESGRLVAVSEAMSSFESGASTAYDADLSMTLDLVGRPRYAIDDLRKAISSSSVALAAYLRRYPGHKVRTLLRVRANYTTDSSHGFTDPPVPVECK